MQWNHHHGRIAALCVRQHIRRLVIERQRDQVARYRVRDLVPYRRFPAKRHEQRHYFSNITKPEAVPVKPLRFPSNRLRINLRGICQRFDAAETQALVADAFADILGGRPNVPNGVNVLISKTDASVRNVKRALFRTLNDEPYRDLAAATGRMCIVSVLYELV